jgi:hypothetical protein
MRNAFYDYHEEIEFVVADEALTGANCVALVRLRRGRRSRRCDRPD